MIFRIAARTELLAAALLCALAASACTPESPSPVEQQVMGMAFDRSILLEETSETSANVSLGDVNGDGHLDAILVKGRHWPLGDPVLLGNGAGSFRAIAPLGAPADRSYSGVLIDLDQDGDLDVVVSNDDPDPKRVYLNDGAGVFTLVSTFGRPEWSTRHVGVGDLNGDGIPDVVLANRTGDDSGWSYLCLGEGGGHFSDACTQISSSSATTITLADFNGDGALDLAIPHREGGQGRIHFNDGSGGFERTLPFGPPDASIRSAEAADFDGNGSLDLVVIDQERGPVALAGHADGTFGDPIALGTSDARPYALHVADLDQDGRMDVIVGFIEARPVAYFNQGGFAFTATPFGDAQGSAYGFDVGDVDEDGFMDIAMARSGAPNVLYFGGPSAAPAVTPR